MPQEIGTRRPLSAGAKAFACEYALDHNAAAAAKRAGYSPKSAKQQACTLLANPDVQELIAGHEKEQAERGACSKEALVAKLWQQLCKACAEEKVSSAIARIADQLNRMHGWHVEAPKTLRVIRSVQDLSDAELEAIVASGAGTDGPVKH